MNPQKLVATLLFASSLCLLPYDAAAMDPNCICGNERLAPQAITRGFIALNANDLPVEQDKIKVCLWREQKNDADGTVSKQRVYDHPVKGELDEEGFKFELDKDWGIRGKKHLLARPRLVNLRITKKVANNDCPEDLNTCSVYFEYWFRKAWDVEVKPIADDIDLTVKLTSTHHAEQLPPDDTCAKFPERGSYQPGEENFFTFQIEEDFSLKLELVRTENGELKASMPITVKESQFSADNEWKKPIYIRAELKKRNSRGTIASRPILLNKLDAWGLSRESEADPEDGPKIVIKRLF